MFEPIPVVQYVQSISSETQSQRKQSLLADIAGKVGTQAAKALLKSLSSMPKQQSNTAASSGGGRPPPDSPEDPTLEQRLAVAFAHYQRAEEYRTSPSTARIDFWFEYILAAIGELESITHDYPDVAEFDETLLKFQKAASDFLLAEMETRSSVTFNPLLYEDRVWPHAAYSAGVLAERRRRVSTTGNARGGFTARRRFRLQMSAMTRTKAAQRNQTGFVINSLVISSLTDARQDYQTAADLAKELIDAEPGNALWQNSRTRCLREIPRINEELRRFTGVRGFFEKAREWTRINVTLLFG